MIPEDAMDEPAWCFIADTIKETIFRSKKGAGKAVAELTSDLLNDDALMVRVRVRERCLIVEFSFDIDGIVCEQVRAWSKDKDAIEGYLRKLQMKEGHWRQRNRSLGGYGI